MCIYKYAQDVDIIGYRYIKKGEFIMKFDIDETVLWKGKPKQGIAFSSSDVFLIPFSLMWGGFAFFWEITVLKQGAPMFFKLWGIPFCIVGLYIIIGRFIHDYLNRKNTEYFVTDKRVVIVKYSKIESILKGQWQTLRMIEYKDGTGSILFFEEPKYGGRSRRGFLNSEAGGSAFFRIENSNEVMKLLTE